jgi:hypothetical protein
MCRACSCCSFIVITAIKYESGKCKKYDQPCYRLYHALNTGK